MNQLSEYQLIFGLDVDCSLAITMSLNSVSILVNKRMKVNISDGFVRKAQEEAVLHGQLEAVELVCAGAGHYDWGPADQMDHQGLALHHGQVVHAGRVHLPLYAGPCA